jgi:hypothetical protein
MALHGRASQELRLTHSDPARDKIVENLSAAIDRLRVDVARVEMWATALIGFSRPIPDYHPDQYILPPERRDRNERSNTPAFRR